MRKLILAVALALPAVAQAASFQNGSFELGPNPGTFTTLNLGSTAITGWTVGGGSVDYIGSYWTAQDGARSLDLAGNGPGGIGQTFSTIVGRDYTVDFYLGGNSDGPPVIKNVGVSATGGAFEAFTVDTTGSTIPGIVWTKYTYNFTASSASTVLGFGSLDNTAYGPALDNVSVSLNAVPEPASWALMIGGFGLVGAASRRRRLAVA